MKECYVNQYTEFRFGRQVFFSALVDVAGHSKDIDKAFSILDNMKKSGIKPGAVVYSSLMGVCSNVMKQTTLLLFLAYVRKIPIKT
jgi:pentatricopeptide repeat protein